MGRMSNVRSAAAVLLGFVAVSNPGCGSVPSPPERFTNSLGMVMLLVRAPRDPGPGEPGVDYYLSATEVTNRQYEQYRSRHRDRRAPESPGDQHPATRVSFQEAQDFARWLAKREGREYSLPREAQWQWAAQAGRRRLVYATADGTASREQANVAGSGGRDVFEGAAPVGSFPPNPFGFFDLTGNVWEWCDDWYDERWVFFRAWLSARWLPGVRVPFFWYGRLHRWRVLRGGSFVQGPEVARVTVRNAYRVDHQAPSWGFRVAAALGNR